MSSRVWVVSQRSFKIGGLLSAQFCISIVFLKNRKDLRWWVEILTWNPDSKSWPEILTRAPDSTPDSRSWLEILTRFFLCSRSSKFLVWGNPFTHKYIVKMFNFFSLVSLAQLRILEDHNFSSIQPWHKVCYP